MVMSVHPDRHNRPTEARMPYQTPFTDFVYPDESGRPCSTLYRIAFADTQERLAVIHVRHINQADQSPASSSIVRDQIVTRILDDDLKGVPVNIIRLVVEDGGASAVFGIEVDIDDYRQAKANMFGESIELLRQVNIRWRRLPTLFEREHDC